ncbi:MAG: DUF5329 domain-containing protein [Thiobacillus sp.]|nr:DUF5329 domain-containing protein [Thiobacillus sp.]
MARSGLAAWCSIVLAASLFATPLQADPVPAAARAEIGALLSKLAASECRFKRNGSWHTSIEARDHLQRKFDYLAEKGAVNSAEQFIERAATRSSLSGQAYKVQCGNHAAVPSGAWLTSLLRTLRTQRDVAR